MTLVDFDGILNSIHKWSKEIQMFMSGLAMSQNILFFWSWV